MKNKYQLLYFLLLAVILSMSGCKKEATPPESWKKNLVTGAWKQKDLVISVTVKLGKQTIPAGTSMITIAPLLGQALGNPAIATGLICTKNNTYSFNADNTYSITGCTDLILPQTGNSGTWKLTIYDAVVQFTSASGKDDPHWINSIGKNSLQLALTLSIPGVGNLPLGLILEKQ